jgi:tetrahydromethanopterin S-methyltransferase subunit B
MENMAKTQAEQAARLDDLEAVDNLSVINANVEKLTALLENSKETLERQEKRLEALEARDGEKWRQVTGYIITAVTGIILGFIATHLGL